MKPAWCVWMMWSLLARCSMRSLITCGNCSRGFKWSTLGWSPRSANCSTRKCGTLDILYCQTEWLHTYRSWWLYRSGHPRKTKTRWTSLVSVPTTKGSKLLTQLTEEKLTPEWYPEAEATSLSLKRSCMRLILRFPWNFKVCCHNYLRVRSMYRFTPTGPCPKLEFF